MSLILRYFSWCCRTGLNCRPLPYQGSALPLSYGSEEGTAARRRGEPATRAAGVQGLRVATDACVWNGSVFLEAPLVDECAVLLAATPPKQLSGAMTKAGSTGGSAGPRSAGRGARTQRLAAALKVNLRRRKAQARERAAEAGQPADDAEPAGAHDSARVVVDKRSA